MLDFKRIEQRAFKLIKSMDSRGVPAQTIQQFMEGKSSEIKALKHLALVVYFPKICQVLPDFISKQLREALQIFERQIPDHFKEWIVIGLKRELQHQFKLREIN